MQPMMQGYMGGGGGCSSCGAGMAPVMAPAMSPAMSPSPAPAANSTTMMYSPPPMMQGAGGTIVESRNQPVGAPARF
jgi:hypothetical protein